ncbi:MAG: hypothetical protein LQ351_000902 [Letrouitia transgressa]|nr:MAG: hypothetical protein LQ351_000902 [Letrouitia transgressa]
MTVRVPPNERVGTSSHASSIAYSVTTNRQADHRFTTNAEASSASQARFPHIKDLQAKATTAQSFGSHTPVGLIEIPIYSQQSANQAASNVSFKRPDLAYVEYLSSSTILLELIPRHKDYPALQADREEWARTYKSLCKQNDAQHEMFKQIYDLIVEDNTRSGVRPSIIIPVRTSSRERTDRNGRISSTNPRPVSMPPTPNSASEDTDELFMPSSKRYSSPSRNAQVSRLKPMVHPKPEGLQSRPVTAERASPLKPGDQLAERFSHLRVARKDVPDKVNEKQPLHPDEFVDMPSPTQFTPPSSNGSPHSRHQYMVEPGNSLSFFRPNGPRDMPPPHSSRPPEKPPHPPKIPLDVTSETPFPRAPSPAYTPSKTSLPFFGTTAAFSTEELGLYYGDQEPRHTSINSAATPNGHVESSLISSNLDSGVQTTIFAPASTTSITAETLSQQLRECRVLLIDVRDREVFDEGHIFANSIICIEPVSLTPGMSAEQLEERLVVSPPKEQDLFEQRDKFDLVVFYDQATSSDRFLTGPPTRSQSFALRLLHDALYEFSYDKPLQRRPLLLKGGIEAWIDLVGTQGLALSRTAAVIGSTRSRNPFQKPGRPLGRFPMASANSSLEVRKRRLREHKPLDAEEEKLWLETARKEEVDTTDYHHTQSDSESDSAYSEMSSPVVQSYEDFLRRFPEPSSIPQSMTVPLPPPPARPPPSLPSIPSRPPPAAPRPSYSGVSERASSQISPTSRLPLSAQPPLYTSKTITHYLKLPRTGLDNFGVTCYMNATVQCLLATIPLSQFFLDNRWRDFIQKNWKGSKGIMPEIYANLIRSLWRGDVHAIRPITLRNLCSRLNPEWGLDRQQDAKEYLDFLLDCLHEDLNVHWRKDPLAPLNVKQELQRERMPIQEVSKIEWGRYCHREFSFISNLFAGQHASRLRCTTCNSTSTTYEAFYSISVEIPRSGNGNIYDCLRSYCQEERLSKDEMWKCPHCNCQREATKQILITRAPQFLVVHFKRFTASKTETARKVHTPIQFPLHGLNMEPYMIQTTSQSRDQVHSDQPPDAATTPPYLYDAYAVMRHLGQTGNGGHYIGLVRDAARGCWRKFDDDRVDDFDPNKLKSSQRLQNEQAYLVFYGRQGAR